MLQAEVRTVLLQADLCCYGPVPLSTSRYPAEPRCPENQKGKGLKGDV